MLNRTHSHNPPPPPDSLSTCPQIYFGPDFHQQTGSRRLVTRTSWPVSNHPVVRAPKLTDLTAAPSRQGSGETNTDPRLEYLGLAKGASYCGNPRTVGDRRWQKSAVGRSLRHLLWLLLDSPDFEHFRSWLLQRFDLESIAWQSDTGTNLDFVPGLEESVRRASIPRTGAAVQRRDCGTGQKCRGNALHLHTPSRRQGPSHRDASLALRNATSRTQICRKCICQLSCDTQLHGRPACDG